MSRSVRDIRRTRPRSMKASARTPSHFISSAQFPSSGGGVAQDVASIGRIPAGSGWRSRWIIHWLPRVWNSANSPVTRRPCSRTLTSFGAHFSVS